MTFTGCGANSRFWRVNPKPLSVTAVSLGPEGGTRRPPHARQRGSCTPFAFPDGKEATRWGPRGGAAAGASGSSGNAKSRQQPGVTNQGA